MTYIDTFISLENNTEIKKRWEIDVIWRENTYRLDQIAQYPSNCVLHYLQDRPDRAFVREEFMQVSEDTLVPPDWVSEWR